MINNMSLRTPLGVGFMFPEAGLLGLLGFFHQRSLDLGLLV
jgi:hypothetical protein